jgi:predicted nucleic acid-binding protein
MKRVLIDASSAILLHKANIFQDMAEHYLLMMVPTVFREITVAHRCGANAFREASDAGKIRMAVPVSPCESDAITTSLHAGELETIEAYNSIHAHFIIMDDGKGARACRTMGIPYINALLCPGILYLSGRINAETRQSAFEHLQEIGRYGDAVISYAERADGNGLASFLP